MFTFLLHYGLYTFLYYVLEKVDVSRCAFFTTRDVILHGKCMERLSNSEDQPSVVSRSVSAEVLDVVARVSNTGGM